jgi:predicted RNA binding protein YcfA (HicA-like mRNA interferase family)
MSRQQICEMTRESSRSHQTAGRNGWYQARMKGSHRQFKHASKTGTVTVAGKLNVDIPPGTLNSILKQAELEK